MVIKLCLLVFLSFFLPTQILFSAAQDKSHVKASSGQSELSADATPHVSKKVDTLHKLIFFLFSGYDELSEFSDISDTDDDLKAVFLFKNLELQSEELFNALIQIVPGSDWTYFHLLIHDRRIDFFNTIKEILTSDQIKYLVNLSTLDGDTPLHLAEGVYAMTQILLDAGADIDQVNYLGETPLVNALCRGHFSIANFLIAEGADTRIFPPQRHLAAEDRTLTMRGFYDKGAMRYHDGSLKKKWVKDFVRESVLRGLFYRCRDLDIDFTNYNDPEVLFNAIENQDFDVVKLLVDCGVNVNTQDERGYTPLIAAIKEENEEIVQLLLDAHADTLIKTYQDSSALMIAASVEHIGIFKKMLAYPHSIDDESLSNTTALTVAIRHYNNDAVKELLIHHANPNYTNQNNRTPLLCALKECNQVAIDLLIAHGADKEAKDSNGYSLLMQILFLGGPPSVELAIKLGCPLDEKTREGWTALILAAEAGYVKVVDILLKHGASVDLADNNGWTPLIFAVHYGQENVVDSLLAAKASVNISNNGRMTALMIAAILGRERIVKKLLLAGASLAYQTADGLSARDLATPDCRAIIDEWIAAHPAPAAGAAGPGGSGE